MPVFVAIRFLFHRYNNNSSRSRDYSYYVSPMNNSIVAVSRGVACIRFALREVAFLKMLLRISNDDCRYFLLLLRSTLNNSVQSKPTKYRDSR